MSVMKSRPLTGCQMLLTCRTVTPYTQTHGVCLSACASARERTLMINLNYTMECRPCAISSCHVNSHMQQRERERKNERQMQQTERVCIPTYSGKDKQQ